MGGGAGRAVYGDSAPSPQPRQLQVRTGRRRRRLCCGVPRALRGALSPAGAALLRRGPDLDDEAGLLALRDVIGLGLRGLLHADRALRGGTEAGGPQHLLAHGASDVPVAIPEMDGPSGRIVGQAGDRQTLRMDQMFVAAALVKVDADP